MISCNQPQTAEQVCKSPSPSSPFPSILLVLSCPLSCLSAPTCTERLRAGTAAKHRLQDPRAVHGSKSRVMAMKTSALVHNCTIVYTLIYGKPYRRVCTASAGPQRPYGATMLKWLETSRTNSNTQEEPPSPPTFRANRCFEKESKELHPYSSRLGSMRWRWTRCNSTNTSIETKQPVAQLHVNPDDQGGLHCEAEHDTCAARKKWM